MNWTSLLKFRKQVEDLAREEVVLAEWEKSQEVSTCQRLREEMDIIVTELEQWVERGMESMFIEERYQWLDRLALAIERHAQRLQTLDTTLVGLRKKLQKAYHARRVVELVIAKKEKAFMQKIAAQEQQLQEDVSCHAFAVHSFEEMT